MPSKPGKSVLVKTGKAEARSARTSSLHEKARWTFLTNHSHVLILLSRDSSMVLREVAAQIGITERAVQRIIAELEDGGFIEREKIGRQNHYRIRTRSPLRHPIESHRTIGDLLNLIGDSKTKN
jgi:predicted DNA-binding transcriptional regulator